MAIPTLLVVVAVTWAGTRAVTPHVDDDRPAPVDATTQPLDRFGVGVALGIGVMLVGFFVSSLLGIEPVWIAAAAAAVLGVAAVATRRFSLPAAVCAASPGFVVFVAALGIVVGAAQRHGLDDLVRSIIPHNEHRPSLFAGVSEVIRGLGCVRVHRGGHSLPIPSVGPVACQQAELGEGR